MASCIQKRLSPKCPASKSLAGSNNCGSNIEMVLPDGAVAHRDLPYSSAHEKHTLDLFLPKHVADGLVPILFYIHPGGYANLSKEIVCGCDFYEFLDSGFAVCSANFRLAPDYTFPTQIEDLKGALRWLRAHAAEYSLDPNRVAAFGGSSAGNLAAMLGVTGNIPDFDVGENLDQSSALQCCIDQCGATDFTLMDEQAIEGGVTHNQADSPESLYLGGAIQEIPEITARANCINYVTADTPPFLICHGDSDLNVPYLQSVIFVEALRNAGVPTSFYTLVGVGHDMFNQWPESPALVRLFLARHLAPAPRCKGSAP